MEASLKDIKDLLEEDEGEEQKLRETLGKAPPPPPDPLVPSVSGVAEVAKEWAKYLEVHQKASFTNTELHKAMNLHITNLRLLSGPLEGVKAALPAPSLSEGKSRLSFPYCDSAWFPPSLLSGSASELNPKGHCG